MAMKEADQFFENLENMIRQRAPEAMEEEQKRLDVESQELSKVFEIYKFPPKVETRTQKRATWRPKHARKREPPHPSISKHPTHIKY